MSTTPTPTELQFVTAEPVAGAAAEPAQRCAQCSTPIATSYYEVGGSIVCAGCKGKLEHGMAGGDTSRAGRVSRATLFGVIGAIIGGAIWYAVAAMFNLEIGLIAILVGWLVGRGVNMGSAGRGGRRYQVIAAVLTYLAVAGTYTAFVYRASNAIVEETAARLEALADSADVQATVTEVPAGRTSAATAAATTPAAADSVTESPVGDEASTAPAGILGFMMSIGILIGLPIMANLDEMPGGIIGIAIIAFGIMQAWRMNEPSQLVITGPHRLNRTDAA